MPENNPTSPTTQGSIADLMSKLAPIPDAKPSSAQPTITTKSLHHPPEAPVYDAPELDPTLEARPLVLPDFATNVRAVRGDIALRWVEFRLLDGRRFVQAKLQGFVPVVKGDVEGVDQYLNSEGHYVNGDIILMKMDRRRYLAALKHKDESAEYLVRKPVEASARKQVGQYALPATDKVKQFVPSEAEMSRLGK